MQAKRLAVEYTAPFPTHGGKARCAADAWDAFGEVTTYVEPFARSCAVALRAPYAPKRVIVNDIDCLLVNFWRAIRYAPECVAWYADWPTTSVDLQARREWVRQSLPGLRERMTYWPEWYCARLAGYWVWVTSNSIDLGVFREPTEAAQGQYAAARAVVRPEGMNVGMQHMKARRGGQGVSVQRVGVANTNQPPVPVRPDGMDGSMVHIRKTRGGRGVNAQRVGVASAKQPPVPVRPEGMKGNMARVGQGQGVNAQRAGADLAANPSRLIPHEWQPLTGQRLSPWFTALCYTMYTWHILCQDWRRVVDSRTVLGITASEPDSRIVAIFFDPPYDGEKRLSGVYSHDSDSIAAEVRRWCLEPYHGGLAPWYDPRFRIIIAGYEDDCDWESELPGGTMRYWKAAGGMNNTNRRQEILYCSPHCIPPTALYTTPAA